jgi:hypothetical protein
VDFITHEKNIKQTLYTQQQGKKEGITFTLKESTNGSSSLGVGEGDEFFHSIILFFSFKNTGWLHRYCSLWFVVLNP